MDSPLGPSVLQYHSAVALWEVLDQWVVCTSWILQSFPGWMHPRWCAPGTTWIVLCLWNAIYLFFSLFLLSTGRDKELLHPTETCVHHTRSVSYIVKHSSSCVSLSLIIYIIPSYCCIPLLIWGILLMGFISILLLIVNMTYFSLCEAIVDKKSLDSR